MDLTIERDQHCFCCGTDNAQGLHLSFAYPRLGEAETELRIPEQFSGWKAMTHGGFLSMLLDEVMAHACLGSAESAVTGEITVRFLKPVETGTLVHLAGKVVEKKGRILSTQGWVYDPAGQTVASATARFLATKPGSGEQKLP